jgi:hypothetical protein
MPRPGADSNEPPSLLGRGLVAFLSGVRQRPARARLPRPVSARIVTIRRTARSSA